MLTPNGTKLKQEEILRILANERNGIYLNTPQELKTEIRPPIPSIPRTLTASARLPTSYRNSDDDESNNKLLIKPSERILFENSNEDSRILPASTSNTKSIIEKNDTLTIKSPMINHQKKVPKYENNFVKSISSALSPFEKSHERLNSTKHDDHASIRQNRQNEANPLDVELNDDIKVEVASNSDEESSHSDFLTSQDYDSASDSESTPERVQISLASLLEDNSVKVTSKKPHCRDQATSPIIFQTNRKMKDNLFENNDRRKRKQEKSDLTNSGAKSPQRITKIKKSVVGKKTDLQSPKKNENRQKIKEIKRKRQLPKRSMNSKTLESINPKNPNEHNSKTNETGLIPFLLTKSPVIDFGCVGFEEYGVSHFTLLNSSDEFIKIQMYCNDPRINLVIVCINDKPMDSDVMISEMVTNIAPNNEVTFTFGIFLKPEANVHVNEVFKTYMQYFALNKPKAIFRTPIICHFGCAYLEIPKKLEIGPLDIGFVASQSFVISNTSESTAYVLLSGFVDDDSQSNIEMQFEPSGVFTLAPMELIEVIIHLSVYDYFESTELGINVTYGDEFLRERRMMKMESDRNEKVYMDVFCTQLNHEKIEEMKENDVICDFDNYQIEETFIQNQKEEQIQILLNVEGLISKYSTNRDTSLETRTPKIKDREGKRQISKTKIKLKPMQYWGDKYKKKIRRGSFLDDSRHFNSLNQISKPNRIARIETSNNMKIKTSLINIDAPIFQIYKKFAKICYVSVGCILLQNISMHSLEFNIQDKIHQYKQELTNNNKFADDLDFIIPNKCIPARGYLEIPYRSVVNSNIQEITVKILESQRNIHNCTFKIKSPNIVIDFDNLNSITDQLHLSMGNLNHFHVRNTTINFGFIDVGSEVKKILKLYNGSSQNMFVYCAQIGRQFITFNNRFTIEPNGFVEFPIIFKPSIACDKDVIYCYNYSFVARNKSETRIVTVALIGCGLTK
eukprot:TRINITY_DN487_c0_g1_i1.p1 TRINITY_DN487_c0_g1~~TRINITY_DN487_c0_g1_i1.p1  ORF type:complete len:964 (+),score=220.52 TRINITY_DN487_c0_g1_i1:78-2969(+)